MTTPPPGPRGLAVFGYLRGWGRLAQHCRLMFDAPYTLDVEPLVTLRPKGVLRLKVLPR